MSLYLFVHGIIHTDPRGIIHGVERGGYLQRNTPLKTKTRLRIKGISDTAELKEEIQCLVRDIVHHP
jgi:hypothetical protein